MSLSPGDPAPDFSVLDHEGNVALAEPAFAGIVPAMVDGGGTGREERVT